MSTLYHVRIVQLEEHVINQIAAGEVVIRPSNVVKELVENSIDAMATNISIYIEDGGVKYLKIIDDGEGISESDLSLAVLPFATSKVKTLDDIDGVGTLGFRGEALASIGSVSRLTLTSKTKESLNANTIVVDNGNCSGVTPASHVEGTTVEVRQLFGRVPARKKFLKSFRSETSAISEVVKQVAVARPEVGITLFSGNRKIKDFRGNGTPRSRALAVLGNELESLMCDCIYKSGDYHISGVIGQPELATNISRKFYLVVNGRVIKDRSLLHAVREGYRGLIHPGFTPVGVIWIDIPNHEIDVNVHPQKTEVRFSSPDAVFRLIQRGVYESINKSSFTPSIKLADISETYSKFKNINKNIELPSTAKQELNTKDSVANENNFKWSYSVENAKWLRVNKTFIVVSDSQGLLLIDHHALHERILFEKIMSRLETSSLVKQDMIVPLIVKADEHQQIILETIQPLLSKISINAESVGAAGIMIHGFPDLLLARKVDPVKFLLELLSKAESFDLSNDLELVLHAVIDMMACKAAVKAGDNMSDREINDLLNLREEVERSDRCPHGRPTSLRISIKELERMFGRS